MEDYKGKTIESYNKNAKELSKKFKKLMNLKGRYEFGRFLDLIPGNEILDLGCGSGDHSLYFKNQRLDVTSIDLSEEMIKLCKDKGIKKAFLMDIENLKFEKNSFDGIWAVTSLLHIPKQNINSVVEKLHYILKKQGILYVCIKEGRGEKFIRDKYGKRYFVFWEEKELLKIFEVYFEFIESKRIEFENNVFLEMFFRKK